MKVGFIARPEAPNYAKLPVDLTNATVTVNIRRDGATSNAISDGACSIVSPATDGVVRGPATSLTTPGGYEAVFTVTGLTNGPHEFPSSGVYRIEVEDDFES